MNFNKFDHALMDTAIRWSELSHANNLKVGCVIAKDTRIISIGYNGMPVHLGNNCENSTGATKSEVIHAEHNAILFAAKNGISLRGCVAYVTHSPCSHCSSMLITCGIKKVIYDKEYISSKGLDLSIFDDSGTEVVKYVDRSREYD